MNILTYKVKLDPSENLGFLIETLKAEKDVFNFVSTLTFKSNYKSHKDLHHLSYYPCRTKFPDIPSQIVIKGIQSLLTATRSIKSNKHKVIEAPQKKRLSLQLDKRLFTLKGSNLRVTTLQGRKDFTFTSYEKLDSMLETYELTDPKLNYDGKDVWFCLSFKIPEKITKETKVLGVDLGIRRTVATSNGKLIKDKKHNKRKREVRYLKRNLQSKGTKSAKRHLKKLRTTERNLTKQHVHNVTNMLLKEKCETYVLEDLTKLKTKKHKYQNKNHISQVPFYLLKETLSYKAQLIGRSVETVNPAYTSQTNHLTGKKDGTRLGCRYLCPNKIVLDADHNAAVNIAKRYADRRKLPISYKYVLDGQATVNSPNV